MILAVLSLLTVGLTTNSYASDLTIKQQSNILEKCKIQAAELAHKVDENSKEHSDDTEFKSSKIIRIDGGYSVVGQYNLHWDIESFDPSDFTVVMSATLGGACELNSIKRKYY